jgi:DNA-directed RNA polymerase sigma subunit (sigma70/sigma32)
LNLTRERIRQIERKALGRLRGDRNIAELRELLA